ncbi:hypothetical protein FNAPI_3458 [Fusarium napiforme]|uniref:Uncharacterized protein n=1 Tax=Fusarium napiforme TaxID=42672 RepID=A0A8H5JWH0_9HYPO|nr:hypothetical protein FNAPI_3458 [Fusarium napiforme]
MDSWCFPNFNTEPVKETDDVHRPSTTAIPIFLDHNGGAAACPQAYETPVTCEEHCIDDAATWERPLGETRTSSSSLEDTTLEYTTPEVHSTTEKNTHIYTGTHPRRLALSLPLILALAVAFTSVRSLVLTAMGSAQHRHSLIHTEGKTNEWSPKRWLYGEDTTYGKATNEETTSEDIANERYIETRDALRYNTRHISTKEG